MSDYSIRPMVTSDVERVLSWRNHEEVRRYMFSTHEIGIDEHWAWYGRAIKNPDISLLIYEQSGEAHGFINIKVNRSSLVAEWGFYLAPKAPRGSGQKLGKLAIEYAFSELRIHKLCGQAIGFNNRSITFHRKLGFIEEGILRKHHFDGTNYHDIVCFGLLKGEVCEIKV